AADHRVGAEPAVHNVVAGVPFETVISASADQRIIAGIADQRGVCVGRAGIERVVAAAGENHFERGVVVVLAAHAVVGAAVEADAQVAGAAGIGDGVHAA